MNTQTRLDRVLMDLAWLAHENNQYKAGALARAALAVLSAGPGGGRPEETPAPRPFIGLEDLDGARHVRVVATYGKNDMGNFSEISAYDPSSPGDDIEAFWGVADSMGDPFALGPAGALFGGSEITRCFKEDLLEAMASGEIAVTVGRPAGEPVPLEPGAYYEWFFEEDR